MKKRIGIMILCVLMICIGNAARSGAGETINLGGEWDAVLDNGSFGVNKDIIKISQEGNTFVGIITIGSVNIAKGEEIIKGELIDKMISQVYTQNHTEESIVTGERVWTNAQGVIIDKGNKLVIQSYAMNVFVKTISMTRKK